MILSLTFSLFFIDGTDDEKESSEDDEDEDDDSNDEDDDIFYIEKILRTRTVRGQVQYLLKWVGDDVPTWSVEEQILDKNFLEAFKKDQEDRKKNH